jgi:hypothetical protein
MPVQGDQAGATTCCWCGGGADKGVKEGPPGAPYYAGAASRVCYGGCIGCCCKGRIPGHIEMVPI